MEFMDLESGVGQRSGPTVRECIYELEQLKLSALRQIRDLTDQREAMDHAKMCETMSRKNTKYVVSFLEKNHALTAKILNLRVRYLGIKYTFLCGMIEKLLGHQFNDVAPPYLRVKTFNDWLKHCPIIYEIQDEILQTRTSKVRLKTKFISIYFKDENPFLDLVTEGRDESLKSIGIRLRTATHDMAFMKDDIDKIQRHLVILVKDAKNQPNKEFDVLYQLLSDPDSFENKKINDYVTECLQCENKNEEGWDSILVFEDNCPDPYTEAIPGANPLRYQEYTKALTLYICDKLKTANVAEDPLTVFAALEHKILPRIFPKAMVTIRKEEEDAILKEKCHKLRGLTQKQIGVAEEYCNKGPLPWYSAVSRFKSLVFSMTPTKIMQAISFAAQDIHREMQRLCPNKVVGADDFLPIWVYCIIKANVQDLASMVNFLKGYLNPDLRHCEIGYYVTCLEGSCLYLQELPDEQEFDNRHYLVFDKAKYEGLEEKGMVRVVEEERVLTGYKLYVNTTLITRDHLFYHCAVVPTGLDTDTVSCSEVSFGPNLNYTQREAFATLLNTKHYHRVQVGDYYTVQVKELSEEWLACGDYGAVKRELQLVTSLGRISVLDQQERTLMMQKVLNEEDFLPETVLSRISLKYGFYLKTDVAVIRFISEVQLLLQHLDYYSTLLDIDGVYSDLMVTALKTFQTHQNKAGEFVESLPETGLLCKDTYNRLRDVLEDILNNLLILKYKPEGNVLDVRSVAVFRSFVSAVQGDLKVNGYLTGSFTTKTVKCIHIAVYEKQVASWCNPLFQSRSGSTSIL